MSRISELFNSKKTQEKAAAEQRRREAASQQQAIALKTQQEHAATLHRQDIERRAEPLRKQVEKGPISYLLEQAGEVLGGRGGGYFSSGEEGGRIYVEGDAHNGPYNGGVDLRVRVRQYLDGEVEVIGKKTKHLRGRYAQDSNALDKAIGDATEKPQVTITSPDWVTGE